MVHRPNQFLAYAFPNDEVGDLPRKPEPRGARIRAVPWDAVDDWYEEGRRLVNYPPNPYHRVDCHPTQRRLHVDVGGTTLVDTDDTVILFETTLAPVLVRRYVARAHRPAAPTETTSWCNYKGPARYWAAVVGDIVVEDVAWTYEDPLPESTRIEGCFSFDPTRATSSPTFRSGREVTSDRTGATPAVSLRAEPSLPAHSGSGGLAFALAAMRLAAAATSLSFTDGAVSKEGVELPCVAHEELERGQSGHRCRTLFTGQHRDLADEVAPSQDGDRCTLPAAHPDLPFDDDHELPVPPSFVQKHLALVDASRVARESIASSSAGVQSANNSRSRRWLSRCLRPNIGPPSGGQHDVLYRPATLGACNNAHM